MRPWNLLLIAVMMLTVLEMVTAAVFFAWALFAKDARLPVQCKTIGLFLCLCVCVCLCVGLRCVSSGKPCPYRVRLFTMFN